MQIVLARLDSAQEVVRLGRVDLGERHVFREIVVPVSLMWLNNGSAADVAAAERFARTEGYGVFCYEGEGDPLGRARRDVRQNQTSPANKSS